MPEPSAAIVVEGLSKRFGALIAVDSLRFDVAPGEIFCLVGPDGAGKTTTMRMLAGVLPPDAGSVAVVGYDIVGDPESVKNHISYMPQRFGLYEELTVDENIRFYADIFGIGRREREQRAERLLAAAGMSRFRSRLAGQLSGGMKQKLGLSCALIHTPRVLLLDEPTTGVDPVSRRDFWRILYGLAAEGVTVLASTAYLDEAERCHRLALLHHGHLLLCDAPARLKSTMPGTVLAVTTPRPATVRDSLLDAPGISSLLVVGDGVHLVVEDAERHLPAVHQRLAALGIAAADVARIAPTIEDLFVASIRGRGGGGA
ncbi:MAG TPA: ABC transporter ATP-binding protein [Candidatus Acidoferrales bacterium]|nr:ABC transporter ATP-binding protein [Candidatus Acidoferrales bacterium]